MPDSMLTVADIRRIEQTFVELVLGLEDVSEGVFRWGKSTELTLRKE